MANVSAATASFEQFEQGTGARGVRLHVQKGDAKAMVEVYNHGAHVTKWEETGQSPLLFLSKKAILNGSKPIRGGIPLIFPQFSSLGPLPTHGFARNQPWTFVGCQQVTVNHEAGIEGTWKLEPTDMSRKIWNHDFVCEYIVRLCGASSSHLTCTLRVTNTSATSSSSSSSSSAASLSALSSAASTSSSASESKSGDFSFTCALHSYYQVGDISRTAVTPLAGLSYRDTLQKGKVCEQKENAVTFAAETDRVYLNVPRRLTIEDEALSRKIHLVTANLPDAVVWNPWVDKAKSFADFELSEYKQMVCVEAAAIAQPVTLAPGQVYTGSLEMYHEPLSEQQSTRAKLTTDASSAKTS